MNESISSEQLIAGLLHSINEQIKLFVQAIGEDLQLNEEELFFKTTFEKMCYCISLYHKGYNQTITYAIPIDEFLVACQQKTIEVLLNEKIREMLLKFGGEERELFLY